MKAATKKTMPSCECTHHCQQSLKLKDDCLQCGILRLNTLVHEFVFSMVRQLYSQQR